MHLKYARFPGIEFQSEMTVSTPYLPLEFYGGKSPLKIPNESVIFVLCLPLLENSLLQKT